MTNGLEFNGKCIVGFSYKREAGSWKLTELKLDGRVANLATSYDPRVEDSERKARIEKSRVQEKWRKEGRKPSGGQYSWDHKIPFLPEKATVSRRISQVVYGTYSATELPWLPFANLGAFLKILGALVNERGERLMIEGRAVRVLHGGKFGCDVDPEAETYTVEIEIAERRVSIEHGESKQKEEKKEFASMPS